MRWSCRLHNQKKIGCVIVVFVVVAVVVVVRTICRKSSSQVGWSTHSLTDWCKQVDQDSLVRDCVAPVITSALICFDLFVCAFLSTFFLAKGVTLLYHQAIISSINKQCSWKSSCNSCLRLRFFADDFHVNFDSSESARDRNGNRRIRHTMPASELSMKWCKFDWRFPCFREPGAKAYVFFVNDWISTLNQTL